MKSVPDSVYRLVVAEVGDYERKKKVLEKSELSREKMIEYSRKVAIIDTAMQSVCIGESGDAKRALLSDIALMKGHSSGYARRFYLNKKTYMRRKRDAVITIAKLLELM